MVPHSPDLSNELYIRVGRACFNNSAFRYIMKAERKERANDTVQDCIDSVKGELTWLSKFMDETHPTKLVAIVYS